MHGSGGGCERQWSPSGRVHIRKSFTCPELSCEGWCTAAMTQAALSNPPSVPNPVVCMQASAARETLRLALEAWCASTRRSRRGVVRCHGIESRAGLQVCVPGRAGATQQDKTTAARRASEFQYGLGTMAPCSDAARGADRARQRLAVSWQRGSRPDPGPPPRRAGRCEISTPTARVHCCTGGRAGTGWTTLSAVPTHPRAEARAQAVMPLLGNAARHVGPCSQRAACSCRAISVSVFTGIVLPQRNTDRDCACVNVDTPQRRDDARAWQTHRQTHRQTRFTHTDTFHAQTNVRFSL